MPLSQLEFASAFEAARAIRNGEVSSVELTTCVLKRIERYNPYINAVVTVLCENALARAELADKARAHGDWWGPFHGVPCTVKDTFEMAGVRTTAGTLSLANYEPTRNATVVERMWAAGAVIVGKTNTSELGADWQTYNDVFGTTNNPWDLGRTAGGSSGGSAAAVAAGLSYLCIGSDFAGSIRIPASYCGVYGHKPTLNLVPSRGNIPPLPGEGGSPGSNLAVRGPLARSALDLKMALRVLGGPGTEEAVAYRWTLPAGRGTRLSDYSIGFVLDDPLCPVSSEIREVLAAALEELGKCGAKLEEGWPPGVVPSEHQCAFRYLLAARKASKLHEDKAERIRPRAGALLAGKSPRSAARAAWQDYFRTHDAFLLPTVFLPAFPHDLSERREDRVLPTPEGPRPYMDLSFWVSFATLAGLPATTAPVGLTREGLPVGIQIIGPYLEDATPIELAGQLADILGGFRPPKDFEDLISDART